MKRPTSSSDPSDADATNKRPRRALLKELPISSGNDLVATLPTTKSLYLGRSVAFQQPTEVACFTYDEQRNVHVQSTSVISNNTACLKFGICILW